MHATESEQLPKQKEPLNSERGDRDSIR